MMNYNDFIKEYEVIKKKRPILFQLEHDNPADRETINEKEIYYGIQFPESYRNILTAFGGGYWGFIKIYSVDSNGKFNINDYVSKEFVDKYSFLPIVDLETGDFIGYNISDGKCTEELLLWLHEEQKKISIIFDFYELLIFKGLKNQTLLIQ